MMPSIHRRRGLGAVLAVGAAGLLTFATLTTPGASARPAAHASSRAANPCAHPNGPTRVGHIAGIARAVPVTAGCAGANAEATTGSSSGMKGGDHGGDPAVGTPPLLFHGGRVMGTRSTGPVVLTPIFWSPSGHPMARPYKRILNRYLRDVAAASGTHTNVFSTLNEYFGVNGAIHYRIKFGVPVHDTSPLPADGCTVDGADTADIYADNTGYNACLDDDQIIAETDSVVSAHGMPRDYAHIYVMFLPKHVESCFYPGSTTTADNFCTINHQPSASYCAYHSQAGSGTVYANMPFPIYTSPVGYTCASEATLPVVETPNGNADADTEVSPTSHEIMEAITDPDTVSDWYDSSGYENGDECAYVYGATHGEPGRLFNQVIEHRRYLTQEEFSNRDYFRTDGGCLQSEGRRATR
jgi:hypothetical protein